MNTDKLVVGLAGIRGSGKSLFVEAASEMDYCVVTLGNIVSEETAKLDLEQTQQNIGQVLLQMRARNGNMAVIENCITKIEVKKQNKVIVDDLRTLQEVAGFRSFILKFSLASVLASPETIFSRLFNKSPGEKTNDWEAFRQMTTFEVKAGVGEVLSFADEMIVNDNNIKDFKAKAMEALRRIEKKWLK